MEFKPDKLWYRSLLEAQTELASVVVGMMTDGGIFRELLYESAQRTGTYVANFRITVDGDSGSGFEQMDYRPRKEWYHAGCAEAIDKAVKANSGIGSIAKAAGAVGYTPVISLENDTPYYAEARVADRQKKGYEGDPGNPSNPGAVERYAAKVTARTAQRIYVGKGKWNAYRDANGI